MVFRAIGFFLVFPVLATIEALRLFFARLEAFPILLALFSEAVAFLDDGLLLVYFQKNPSVINGLISNSVGRGESELNCYFDRSKCRGCEKCDVVIRI